MARKRKRPANHYITNDDIRALRNADDNTWIRRVAQPIAIGVSMRYQRYMSDWEADDLQQVAIIAMYRARHKIDYSSHPFGYLSMIAINACNSLLGKRQNIDQIRAAVAEYIAHEARNGREVLYHAD